jgi:hypothetical protein
MRRFGIAGMLLAIITLAAGSAGAQELKRLRLSFSGVYRSLNNFQVQSDRGLRNAFGPQIQVEGRYTDNISLGATASASKHSYFISETDNIPFSLWHLSAIVYGKYYTPPLTQFLTWVKVGAGGSAFALKEDSKAYGKGGALVLGWGVDYFATPSLLVGAALEAQFNYFLDAVDPIEERTVLLSYDVRFLRLTWNFDF